MNKSFHIKNYLLATLLICLAEPLMAEGATVTPLLSEKISAFEETEGQVIIVEYGPGESSRKHRHDAYSFVYVLDGSITMQIEGGKPLMLHPGQTFYETPEDVHLISGNASENLPAKFLVFSVKKKGSPAVIPVF